MNEPVVAVMPGLYGGGGKPTPREWLRGSATAGHAGKTKAKRRAASKRARAARKR